MPKALRPERAAAPIINPVGTGSTTPAPTVPISPAATTQPTRRCKLMPMQCVKYVLLLIEI